MIEKWRKINFFSLSLNFFWGKFFINVHKKKFKKKMFMYNEDEAYNNAIRESLAAQLIPPEQRGIPTNIQGNETGTQIKVREMLASIDMCRDKIKELMELDLNKKPAPKPSPNSKRLSPNISRISQNDSLDSTQQLIRQQDEDFYAAENRQLRIEAEEEEMEEDEDGFLTFDDSIGSHEEDDDAKISDSDTDTDDFVNSLFTDDLIVIKIRLPKESKEFSFQPTALGQKVYDKVSKKIGDQLNVTDLGNFEIVDALGVVLQKDKTLEEQGIRSKTIFTAR